MTTKDSSREAHFPAIEKRYGEKMAYWFKVMAKLEGKKYPEQIAHLRENYGFSQAHANALVMYSRGSESAKRFDTPAQYFKTVTPVQASTMKSVFKAITTKYPQAELVVAWNKPMIKYKDKYIFGAWAGKSYILLAPFDADLLDDFSDKLSDYKVNKKTFQVPSDWQVDSKLILAITKAAIAKLK
ncbi:Protein of unknown function DUF4287 [Candidatus Nanopelagicaceae bacterium]